MSGAVNLKCWVFCLTRESCHKLSLPIMEKCNPISRDIDRVNGKQMVQILRRCDAEIFEKKINHDPFDQVWSFGFKKDI